MQSKLALILSATALVIAVFGSTPLGGAARGVMPFAKNSDTVDGIDASTTPAAGKLVPLNAKKQLPLNVVPGKVTQVFAGRKGPLPVSGKFTSRGGALLVAVSGTTLSFACDGAPGPQGVRVYLDGRLKGYAASYAQPGSRAPFSTSLALAAGRGTHTLRLGLGDFFCYNDNDGKDAFTATVTELPFTKIAPGHDQAEPNDTEGTAPIIVGGTPAMLATKADDDYWTVGTCSLACGTYKAKMTLAGPPKIKFDVYKNGVKIASNRRTYTTPLIEAGERYSFGVHGPAGFYTITRS